MPKKLLNHGHGDAAKGAPGLVVMAAEALAFGADIENRSIGRSSDRIAKVLAS